MQHDALALHTGSAAADDLGDPLVVGVAEGDVADQAALEEGEGPDALGAVDDLVRDDEVHGLDVLLQGADGREGHDAPHADVAQGGDVGARGDLVRRVLVAGAVPRQERHGRPCVLQDHDRRRREPPRRLRVHSRDRREPVELVQPRPADDGDVHRTCCGRVALVFGFVFLLFDFTLSLSLSLFSLVEAIVR